jgi:hypothetical protein
MRIICFITLPSTSTSRIGLLGWPPHGALPRPISTSISLRPTTGTPEARAVLTCAPRLSSHLALTKPLPACTAKTRILRSIPPSEGL